MITVTKINDKPITINAEMIEFIEMTPDTIITMTNGKKIIVKESVETVIDKVVAYRQKCFSKIKIGTIKRT
ncbi:endoflagellar protein [candidate division KSB1 bacterium 4484_188]|nr:MAG: endoflagellar protein [candidate division KSB1 bacterium 4484_188]HFE65156.1 endoflagellar protein [Caldithrix sp.]